MRSALIIGLASGLVSAGAAISAAKGSPALQGLMMMLAPLPILIAGLGWGWYAALAGAFTGAAVLTLGAHVRVAGLFMLMIGAPAILFSYLAFLARDRRDGSGLDWFPTGSIAGAIGLYAAGVPLFLLQLTGGTFEDMRKPLAQFLQRLLQDSGRTYGITPLTPEQLDHVAAIAVDVMPIGLAANWALMFSLGLYVAARVVKAAGLLIRDWPDFTAMQLPKELPWLLLAAIAAATALSGTPRLVGKALFGGLIVPFILLGLATLHTIARQGRRWILWLTYAGLLVLGPLGTTLVGAALAVIGFLEPFLQIRARSNAQPPSPTT